MAIGGKLSHSNRVSGSTYESMIGITIGLTNSLLAINISLIVGQQAWRRIVVQ
jgi:hypothetical protein